MHKFILGMTGLFLAIASCAQPAVEPQSTISLKEQKSQHATRCVNSAAAHHFVNPWILRAILQVESGNKPDALNRNNNGSIDVGIAQINSMHFKELAKHGISPADLMNECVSTYVAAWHLAKQYKAYGNTWFAVGAYHSATPCFNRRYAGLVWNALIEFKAVEGNRQRVQSLSDCGYVSAKPQKLNQQKIAQFSPSLAYDN